MTSFGTRRRCQRSRPSRSRGAHCARTRRSAEIQRDFDVFFKPYNLRRSPQGYRLSGRTPPQVLREVLGIAELSSLTGSFIVSEGEEVTAAA